jgi:hypothetical protein
MKILIILLFSVIGLLSCNLDSKQPYISKVPLTKEFLIHEWMLDSIYGSKEFIQDWVYFTPTGNFWRCTRYVENQLIDSSLTFKGNEIFYNGELKYSIFSLDSNNIILVSKDKTVFHCKRWNEFDQEDITMFVKTNPIKKLLNGRWILDSSEVIPTTIPSHCDKLFPGSKFYFNPNGRLEIYPKDSIIICNNYSYDIWDNEISIRENDMVLGLEIVRLSSTKLILKSTYMPKGESTGQTIKTELDGYNLYLTKQLEKTK